MSGIPLGKRWVGPAIVLGVWGLSRWLAWHEGVRFDSSDLGWAWQFLDVLELREHLARSLWYLHAQPPGFNLLLGLGLKMADHSGAPFYRIVFLGLGAGLHLGLYGMLRLLRLPILAAVLGASFFALTPSSILYENLLLYSYPATALLVLASCALALAVASASRLGWAVFFGALATLVLTVALFHVAWFAACLVAACWLVPGQRRRILIGATPWFLLASFPYFKNLLLFGVFSGSSWFGMNLSRMAESSVPLEVRQQEVLAGHVSPLAVIPSFLELADYPASYREIPRETPRVPVLVDERKSTGTPNFNHAAYLQISHAYLRDSLALIARHPSGYWFSVSRSWLIFMLPPSEYFPLRANRSRLAAYVDAFNTSIYGVRATGPAPRSQWGPRSVETATILRYDGLGWALVSLVSLLICCASARRDLGAAEGDRARGVTLAFMLGTVVFVAFVGNFFEYGENHRFRFTIEPFLVAFILVAGGEISRMLRTRMAPSAPGRG